MNNKRVINLLGVMLGLAVWSFVLPGKALAIVETVIFAGEAYSIADKAVSATTALVSAGISESEARESRKVVEDLIDHIDQKIFEMERKVYAAGTEEETKKYSEELESLKQWRRNFQQMSNDIDRNAAETVSNILINEATSQVSGYVKSELEIPGETEGEIGEWTIEKIINALGYELTEQGQKFLGAGVSLIKGVGKAVYNVATGELTIDGVTISEADMSEDDKAFMKELAENEGSRTRVAITKAKWDKFTEIVAKEKFKQYLRGENENFLKLPLAVQEKYRKRLFLMAPDELEDVNKIMSEAHGSGDYQKALAEISEKYPYYSSTFKDLNKDYLKGQKELEERIERELVKSFEETDGEVDKLAEDNGVKIEQVVVPSVEGEVEEEDEVETEKKRTLGFLARLSTIFNKLGVSVGGGVEEVGSDEEEQGIEKITVGEEDEGVDVEKPKKYGRKIEGEIFLSNGGGNGTAGFVGYMSVPNKSGQMVEVVSGQCYGTITVPGRGLNGGGTVKYKFEGKLEGFYFPREDPEINDWVMSCPTTYYDYSNIQGSTEISISTWDTVERFGGKGDQDSIRSSQRSYERFDWRATLTK